MSFRVRGALRGWRPIRTLQISILEDPEVREFFRAQDQERHCQPRVPDPGLSRLAITESPGRDDT